MISARDLRKNDIYRESGDLWLVLSVQPIRPHKVQIRNLRTRVTSDKVYSENTRLERLDYADRKELSYLYREGDTFAFMDNESFEQLTTDSANLPGAEEFLTETNQQVILLIEDGNPIAILPP